MFERKCLLVAALGLVSCADPATEAQNAIAIEDYARARTVLDPAIDQQPQNAELRELLLLVQEREEDWAGAVQAARVLRTLDTVPRNEFRFLHASAHVGDWATVRSGLAATSREDVNRVLAEALAEAGAISTPDEVTPRALSELRERNPEAFRNASKAVGFDYYLAAQTLAAAAVVEREGYFEAEDVGRDLSQVRELSPALAAAAGPQVLGMLDQLVEPEPMGVPGAEGLYLLNLEQYHRAQGTVLRALQRPDDALDAFRRGATALELLHQINPSINPISGSHRYRLTLLREQGHGSRVDDECASLSSRFPQHFEESPPGACLTEGSAG